MGEYADSLKKKKVVPAQATRALSSETKQQAAVEKKYTTTAKNKGEGAQDASAKAKALNKPQSESVEAARKQAAGIKASQKLNEDAYKNSLPSLNSSFKGVGYIPIKASGGPSGGNDGGNSSGSSGGSGSGGSGSGGSGGSGDEVKTTSMAGTPSPVVVPPPPIVKNPTRNVTDISSLVPQYDAKEIQKILFENLSAIELSRIERHDTIEGIDQRYSIISNLSEIRRKYQQTKQLTVMDKFKPLTSVFTINIQDKIPQEDYILLEKLNTTYQYFDEGNDLIDREKGYYYFDTNGDLVIELINIEKSQQVEVQIDTNGTIYKVELWLQQMVKIS